MSTVSYTQPCMELIAKGQALKQAVSSQSATEAAPDLLLGLELIQLRHRDEDKAAVLTLSPWLSYGMEKSGLAKTGIVGDDRNG